MGRDASLTARTAELVREARALEASLRIPADPNRGGRNKRSVVDTLLAARTDPRHARTIRRIADLRWQVVLLHERLAVTAAKRWRGIERFEDVLQEARIGLYNAASRFDPDRGIGFATLARWWVLAALSRRCHSLPELKGYQQERIRRVLQLRDQGLSESQIGDYLGITVDQVWESLRVSIPTLSLDAPPPGWDEDGVSLLDTLRTEEEPVDEQVIHRELAERVRVAVRGIPDRRERQVVEQRYGLDDGGEGMTLRDVGHLHGLSRERVRQICNHAFGPMRFEIEDLDEAEQA